MEHEHSDSHHHHHHHHHHLGDVKNINRAFIIGIILNAGFAFCALVIGYLQSSLALISDALHNLTDVISLLFSLFAFKMMRIKATDNYSYGYKKISILASLFNSVFLLVITFIIFYEGFQRIYAPTEIDGQTVSFVALAGIFVNGISAWLFAKDKEKDMNIKGAYLHLLGDALLSMGVVAAGIIMYFTQWFWLDTALSFLIGIFILISTWNLLNDSVRATLDGTPRNVNLPLVKETILAFGEIADVHHIHIWAISSSENAMTAHLVLRDNNVTSFEKVKNELRHQLKHLHIHHTTLELETEACGEICDDFDETNHH